MAATARKIITPPDWHRADIKAALEKKGYSFARIARENGYVINSPNMVLRKPWPQMERIVAGIIGVPASDIWPSRYDQRVMLSKNEQPRLKLKLK